VGEKGAKPDLSGDDLTIAVVVARFNEDVSKRLLRGALTALEEHGVKDPDVFWVPGSLELPVTAAPGAERKGPTRTPAEPKATPQARGLGRQTATRTRRLRSFLIEARTRTPSLTVGELLAVAGGREHPELRRLREELGWDPDRRTLERNWPKLRQ